jgi:hypothetical protein
MARLELRAMQLFPWSARTSPFTLLERLDGPAARLEALDRRRLDPHAPLIGGALSDGEARGLGVKLRGAALSDAQLHLLAGSTGYLCAAQARDLVLAFKYEDDRIRALQILAWRILDGENLALFDPLFSTSERRAEAHGLLQR